MTPTEQTKEKILTIPSLKFFDDDWNLLQKFLKSKGNPKWKMSGDLILHETPIETLGNLQSVDGYLFLSEAPIESLGNLTSVGSNLILSYTPIETLGNLTYVGGYLDLGWTPIKSLGNLEYVGGDLYIEGSLLSKTISEGDIKSKITVEGGIYM